MKIATKGKTAYKITPGTRKEDITILATICASGSFYNNQGVNIQGTWRGNNTLLNTCCSMSKNSWITTDIFLQWFNKFTKQVKEQPLLLSMMATLPPCEFGTG